MADLESKIIAVFDKWGLDLVNDTKAEIDKLFSDGGGQASDLSGSVNYKVLSSAGVITFQLTMNDYYKFVEAGRKKGVKGVPTEVLGKQWQNSKGLNAPVILQQISIKAGNKKAKKLPYDKAVKSLAFVIQRSINEKGIKPKPFLNKVITKERLDLLKKMLAPIMKEFVILELKSV